jgi:uncharacterized protein YbaR (Trm112 family)
VQSLGPRLVTYYPPVDGRRFNMTAELRKAARAELGVPDDAFLVGTVGNVNPQKGHELLLESAAALRDAAMPVYVRVLGASTPSHRTYEQRLLLLAAELGLDRDGRVAVADPGGRVPELLPAFDVFALSSVPRSEGVPTVILEAMAAGLPVVATDVGGVRDVVVEGRTGFVVPPLEPAAMAERLVRLARDAGLREAMGSAGQRRFEAEFSLDRCVDDHVQALEIAAGRARVRRAATLRGPQVPPPCQDVRAMLVCPACRARLAWGNADASCNACGTTYPVIDGIPVMLTDPAAADEDEIHHHHHRAAQSRYFDGAVETEFEIERPRGTPRLHRWMLGTKFRRSVAGLEGLLAGTPVLVVCGGSGMDAEYLARAGASVVLTDVSLGAAKRAGERARRQGLPIEVVVADVHRLPFADGAFPLAYVHDGLHHLPDPLDGVREMARVSSQAVSITEPAKAGLTAIAVKLGLALEQEEAGNRVARLRPGKVAGLLRESGFGTRAERYGLLYRHHPGPLMRISSHPPLFAFSRLAWTAFNRTAGKRLGNKLAVTAVRRSTVDHPADAVAPRGGPG